jgi:CTP:molybdopterin cytidylyltransferase MocA
VSGFTALVLAGERDRIDPVAAYAGVPHKALIMLDGKSLLSRVVSALEGAGAQRIWVSTNNAAVADAVSKIHSPVPLEPIAAAASPALSIIEAAERLGTPLLVTTADHALLQPAWISRFLADSPPDADIAVLLAPEASVRAAAPGTRRTYLRFRDGRFSGCNLFFLRNDRALRALALWRRVEAHRKQPWRIALILGPAMLAAALGWLTLDQAIRRLGRRAGVAAAAVRTPFGLAAVDVDKAADLDLVRRLVR